MFDSLGWGEMSVLLVLALFVFGPERLPGLAADLGRGVRRARRALHTLTSDLTDELGPELGELSSLRTDLGRLQPRSMARRLWEDDDSVPGTAPAAEAAIAPRPAVGEITAAPLDPNTSRS